MVNKLKQLRIIQKTHYLKGIEQGGKVSKPKLEMLDFQAI
jgi:hypothetical protein